jgi:hypothetical protein
MSVFGAQYAKSAGTTLAILSLTYIPFVFHHFFLAISRVQNRVRGAGVFSVFAGLTELLAAWYGGSRGSLTELVAFVAIVMGVETILVAPTVLRVVFAQAPIAGLASETGLASEQMENVMSTSSLTLRERAWLPLEYIRTVGPLTGVTAERLRNALIGLHAADPTHRAVSRLDRSGARWVHLNDQAFAAYAQEAVTEVRPGDPGMTDDAGLTDFNAMTRQLLAEPRDHHPLRFLVGEGRGGTFVAMKVAHAYGDAGPVNTLLREVLRAAGEERAAQLPPMLRHKTVLPRTWWKTFGLNIGKIKPTLAVPRPPHSPEGPQQPWTPSLTFESARSADVLAKMRTWRDQYAPGVTTSAITFAAFTAALQQLGIEPDMRGGMFLADARRYVDKGISIDSNFCFGGWISPASLTDPAAIQTMLKAELASGRMLTMMLLRETKIMLLGAPGMPDPYPTQSAVTPHPAMTYSNQGRHDMLSDLPWAIDPAGRVNQSVPTLNVPEGIALATSEMNGVLHLEATFHATTYDPALIARALQLVCTDPAALIMATRA